MEIRMTIIISSSHYIRTLMTGNNKTQHANTVEGKINPVTRPPNPSPQTESSRNRNKIFEEQLREARGGTSHFSPSGPHQTNLRMVSTPEIERRLISEHHMDPARLEEAYIEHHRKPPTTTQLRGMNSNTASRRYAAAFGNHAEPTLFNTFRRGQGAENAHLHRLKSAYEKHMKVTDKANSLARLANHNKRLANAFMTRAGTAWMPWTKLYYAAKAAKYSQRAKFLKMRSALAERSAKGAGAKINIVETKVSRNRNLKQSKDPARRVERRDSAMERAQNYMSGR